MNPKLTKLCNDYAKLLQREAAIDAEKEELKAQMQAMKQKIRGMVQLKDEVFGERKTAIVGLVKLQFSAKASVMEIPNGNIDALAKRALEYDQTSQAEGRIGAFGHLVSHTIDLKGLRHLNPDLLKKIGVSFTPQPDSFSIDLAK